MSQYFPKLYEPFGGDINVKDDLSNYATKTDIKNIAHIDTSSFALKTNLAGLKTEVDKLHIDKLVEILTLKLIFQIMQQKQILKVLRILILQVLH